MWRLGLYDEEHEAFRVAVRGCLSLLVIAAGQGTARYKGTFFSMEDQ